MAASSPVQSRLSEVYGHLFSEETSLLAPSEIAAALLEQSTERDACLLQLSITRKLFSEQQDSSTEHPRSTPGQLRAQQDSSTEHSRSTPGQLRAREAVCRALGGRPDFVPTLSDLLVSDDQFVSFCAGKALCAVLTSPSIHLEEWWLQMLLSHMLSESLSPHVHVFTESISGASVFIYHLEIFTGVLKTLRKSLSLPIKHLHPATIDKQSTVLQAVYDNWNKILQLFCRRLTGDHQPSPSTSSKSLELSFGEFLSLTVEIMRHSTCNLRRSRVDPSEDGKRRARATPETPEESSHKTLDDSQNQRLIGSEYRDGSGNLGSSGSLRIQHLSAVTGRSELSNPSQQDTSFLAIIIDGLPSLTSLVPCTSSLFVLRRSLDILLKAVAIEHPSLATTTLKQLQLAFPHVLKSITDGRIVHLWMLRSGKTLIENSLAPFVDTSMETVKIFDLPQDAGSECVVDAGRECVVDAGLLNTVVRKLVLYLLKYTAALMSRQTLSSTRLSPCDFAYLDSIIGEIQKALAHTRISIGEGTVVTVTRNVLFQVLNEQDDCTIEALLASLQVNEHSADFLHHSVQPRGLLKFLEICQVHDLFVKFLSSVSYDHSVLLDFLVTPETKFSGFLEQYLPLACNEWSKVKQACKKDSTRMAKLDKCHSLQEKSTDTFLPSVEQDDPGPVSDAIDNGSANVFPGLTNAAERKTYLIIEETIATPAAKKLKLDCQPCARECSMSSSSYSDSCESCYSELEKEIVPFEKLLDRVMGCLIRLKFSLERLHAMKLLAPDLPVERIIEALENLDTLYEKDID